MAAAERPVGITRVGRREVVGLDDRGETRITSLDPHRFACSTLAAQLADEWTELCETSEYSYAACRRYRRALIDFFTFVRQNVPPPHRAAPSSPAPAPGHPGTPRAPPPPPPPPPAAPRPRL